MNRPGYGDFGNLSATYDKARPLMPEEVISYLFSSFKNESQPFMLLDLGCGTGIVTRQLATRALAIVVGADKDPQMLKIANEYGEPAITYIEASAADLSEFFRDNEFNVVTAFSAFHWFRDSRSVGEIRRVLKDAGIFFIANRNAQPIFTDGYKKILQTFVKNPIPNAKQDYDPVEILNSAGFREVTKKIFTVTERQSMEDALSYVQTTSTWNLVPTEEKQSALAALREFFLTKSVEGMVERPVDIITVFGFKGISVT